ncbi:MAG: hypothetical protein QNJ73_09370 [Gammaproteobacteria bacterium]|nr:hypothetical protein [Gammaproteobacteria bacterium]
MTGFEFWKYLHILMFVFWIGTDLAVYLSARKSADPSLSFDTRIMLLHWALRIELLPRIMWKAALPLGVMLSVDMGLMDLSGTGVALVWLFTLVWGAVSVTGAYKYDQPVGHKLGQVNNVLTGIVGVGLIGLAIASYAGAGPFDGEATWLLWKVGLYGLINLMVILMLIVFDPMGVAFARMATEGSTPELEDTISSVMSRSTVVIWSTYGTIALVAFIATTKVI